MVKGLKFQNKKAAAFGAYGWSGESVKLLTQELEACGFEVVHEGFRTTWMPNEEALEACQNFGKEFVRSL